MLGGKIEIGGSAGERAGHQMAAGDLLIKGSCGSGLGLDAFGGRISILGKVDRKNMGIGSVTSSLTVTNGAGFWKHTLIRNGVVK
jgi:formylmethanofuran dehydrogenase subunit C